MNRMRSSTLRVKALGAAAMLIVSFAARDARGDGSALARVDWSGSPQTASTIHFFPVPDGQSCEPSNAICEETVFYSPTLSVTQIRDLMNIAFNSGTTTCEQPAFGFHSVVLPAPEVGSRQQIHRFGPPFDLCVFDDVDPGTITKVASGVGAHLQNGILIHPVVPLAPALSYWGMLSLASLIVGVSVLALRRVGLEADGRHV